MTDPLAPHGFKKDGTPKKPQGRPKKKTQRGRPSAGLTGAEIETSRVKLSQSRESMAHNPKRPPRIPMQATANLDTGTYQLDRENYSYRFFSSGRKARLMKAEAAYWEYCYDEAGNKIVRHDNAGDMFLMRIPIEYYLADQELKHKKIRDIVKADSKIGPGEYTRNPSGYAIERDGDFDPLAP